MVVSFTTVVLVAAVPPIVRVAPAAKLVPVMVIAVPPSVVPDGGVTVAMVGVGSRYVKPLASVPLWVSGLVTRTATTPPACAGVVAVMEVLFTTTTVAAAVPPMAHVAPLTKSVAVMVTTVPPSVGPDAGDTVVMVGAVETYVNALASVPLCASGLVTVTLTAPAAWAGVVAVIEVALVITTLVAAAPPIVTVAPATKLVPVIVRTVPPSVDPTAGLTAMTVGAGLVTGLKITICMTHAPELSAAVAV